MPRIKRGIADGLIYHVLNRGNFKRIVFHNECDYRDFLRLIQKSKEKFSIVVYAYCLMPNHFHFVVRPRIGDHLSSWMQWLMTSHVRRYHRYYQTSGHLWQGRYKNFIIQQDKHLLIALRYVERNPVRANLVSSAKEWSWSSHRERIGRSNNKILDDLPIYLDNEWAEYVDTPFTEKELEELRESVNRQIPYGSKKWRTEICHEFGLEHTLRPKGRPKKHMRGRKKEESSKRTRKGDRLLF